MNVLAPVLRWEKVRLTSVKNSRATLAEPFLQLCVTAGSLLDFPHLIVSFLSPQLVIIILLHGVRHIVDAQ